MNKMIITRFPGRFFLLLVLALLPSSVLAQSPWHWQMSLFDNKTGEAMYLPAAVAFDPASERYYAVDAGRNRLVSFNRNGELLKAFSADDRLLAPFDMVRLDNGQLLVVEKGRNSITRIDITAKEVTPRTLRDGDQQIFPDRISHAGGNLYVLDRASGQVLRLDNDLNVVQRFGCPDCMGGFIDFVIADGSVWALATQDKKIFQFLPDGKIAKTIELGEQIDFPVSLALEGSESLYVLDRHLNRVDVFSQDGRFKYSFLGTGQGKGQVYLPRQLRFDPWGQLCVVDEGNGRVEVFSR
jgi:DNA-binding beta-propeller fold protein YncE